MKKIISYSIIIFYLIMMFSGCTSHKKNETSDKIHVVCTLFPQYDWVKEIVGDNDNIEITFLLKNGVDLHSYQPTADDILNISKADLFIYVGGVSDAWVEDALKQASNDKMKIINMMEVLNDSLQLNNEEVEGHEHHDHDSHKHSNIEYDEHVWLSLNNAAIITQSIADALSDIDPDDKNLYQDNCKNYVMKIKELDKEYNDMIKSAKYDTIIFGDRFPFAYLFKDYNLKYFAAFTGCSAESEASFETITFLVEKLNEIGVSVVFTVDSSGQDLAKTIIESSDNKNQEIMVMYSMQSVTNQDIIEGASYLGIMQKNYETLKYALNK